MASNKASKKRNYGIFSTIAKRRKEKNKVATKVATKVVKR